ncbi:hypothetical protein SHIRM173S_08780 [Streptomyces hirsutus]
MYLRDSAALTVGTRPHVPAGLGGDHQFVPVRGEVLLHQPAEVDLRGAVGRSVVVREVVVGDAEVEGAQRDLALGPEGPVVTEVVPVAQGQQGEVEPRTPGASRRSRRDTVASSRRALCSTVRTAAPEDRRLRTVAASASGVTATVSFSLFSSNQAPPYAGPGGLAGLGLECGGPLFGGEPFLGLGGGEAEVPLQASPWSNSEEVRFVYDARDPDALRALMRWKSAQYRRTGRRDRFAQPWMTALAEERLASGDDPECRGLLSVLYAAGRPVAAHFGLRSPTVLSWWFPAYDRDYGKYSPGLVVLHLRMLEAAAADRIRMVDLGSGPARYKDSLKTRELPVYEGAVVRPGPGGAAYRLSREPARAARRFVRDRPRLAGAARHALEEVGRLRDR